jgi:hypothetical protein
VAREALVMKEETIPVDFWGAVSCLLIILFIYEIGGGKMWLMREDGLR